MRDGLQRRRNRRVQSAIWTTLVCLCSCSARKSRTLGSSSTSTSTWYPALLPPALLPPSAVSLSSHMRGRPQARAQPMIWAVQRRTEQGRTHTGLLLRLLRHVADHVAYHGHLAVLQEEAFEGAGPHRPGRQEAEEEAIGQVLEVTPTSAPGLGSPLPTAHLPPLPCPLPSHAHSRVQGRVHARTQLPSMANTCARTLRRTHRCARMRIRTVGHFAPWRDARLAPCRR